MSNAQGWAVVALVAATLLELLIEIRSRRKELWVEFRDVRHEISQLRSLVEQMNRRLESPGVR